MINGITSIVAQVITIIVTFMSRRIFLQVLGENILGINGLFTQIISLMSLMELGIGSAIIYSMYAPLAVDDKEQISALVSLYKKIYTIIGVLVFVVGSALTPFITFFITGDTSEVSNIYLIFMLFVINAALTYFNSYKQNLIVADQKKYIVVLVHNGLFVALNVLQIIILLRTRNYVLYLVLQILVTLIENFLLSKITKKMYPYLSEYKTTVVETDVLNKMKKNVMALVLHKIGTVFVTSTDTIIISKFIGIVVVGKYVNYNYVTNAFSTLTTNLFNSFTSSIGNHNVTASREERYQLFRKLFFLNHVVFGFLAVCTWCLLSDFIRMFYGENMVLNNVVVLLLVLKFYLNGMRATLLTYKDSLGIYHPDRYRPIMEGAVNLIGSIVLVKFMGLSGVILATIISNVSLNTWIEPYVVYKEGFDRKWTDYLIHYIRYIVCLAAVGCVVTVLANHILVYNYVQFFIKACVIAGVSFILILLLGVVFDRKELNYYIALMKKMIMRK